MGMLLTFGTKKGATIHLIEGQYEHPLRGKMWFRTELKLDEIGTDVIPPEDIHDTMHYLHSIVTTNNIHTLMGFSQGANVIDTYLRLTNDDEFIQSAVILNGYTFPRYSHMVPRVRHMQCILSDNDDIVKPSLLINNYPNAILHCHEKGHKINTSKPFVRKVIDSIN